jgi:hypothetical protein
MPSLWVVWSMTIVTICQRQTNQRARPCRVFGGCGVWAFSKTVVTLQQFIEGLDPPEAWQGVELLRGSTKFCVSSCFGGLDPPEAWQGVEEAPVLLLFHCETGLDPPEAWHGVECLGTRSATR